MSVVTYNDATYELIAKIRRINPLKSDEYVDALEYDLPADNINKITLCNDLEDPVPRIEILYRDQENANMSSYPCDGYTVLEYSLKSLAEDEKESIAIVHKFFLRDIATLSRENNQSMLKLTGISKTWFPLNSTVVYSSGPDFPEKHKTVSKIMKDILKKADYPVSMDPDLIESAKKIHWLTTSTDTVIDNIKHLRAWAANSETGLFYLIFSMLSNQGFVISLSQIFKAINDDNIDAPNQLKIPAPIGFGPAWAMSLFGFGPKTTGMGNVTVNSFVTGEGFYEKASLLVLNTFDYIKRAWSTDQWPFARITKLLPRLPSDKYTKYEKIAKDIPILAGKKERLKSDYIPLSYPQVYDKGDPLLRLSDCLQFDAMGYLRRDVGTILKISSVDTLSDFRFNGYWMITRIYHVFTRGNYISNIIAVRVDKVKENG